MKKFLIALVMTAMVTTAMAQGKSKDNGKFKNKAKDSDVKKEKKDKGYDDDNDVWDDNQNRGGGKYSKNQPSKVRAAFMRDYPKAGNVTWSKYRGDWTATFNSGLGWGQSTAVYHANGERRDTRTRIKLEQLPNRTIWDKIFKRDNLTPVNVVQIQSPTLASEIFRITSQLTGGPVKYYYYDSNGLLVRYDY